MRPSFRCLNMYWTSRSSQLLSLCSACGFCPHWADLWTPPLSFWRCTAPVKLRTWHCPWLGVSRCLNVISVLCERWTAAAVPRRAGPYYGTGTGQLAPAAPARFGTARQTPRRTGPQVRSSALWPVWRHDWTLNKKPYAGGCNNPATCSTWSCK